MIAAIIIVGLVIGLAATINTASIKSDQESFYDLGEEIGFETKKVLDFGTVRDKDISDKTKEFLVKYANYIAQEQVIFVYGNESILEAIYFNSETSLGSIGIDGSSTQITDLKGRIADVEDLGSEVKVTIDGINYIFPKNEGNKFYFVLIKEKDDEKFVAKG